MSATPSIASSSGSGPSRQKKTNTHTVAHSIRAQAASSASTAGTDKGKGRDGGLVGNSKIVYKALLESPLNVKWPSLPTHLQLTVVHTLCGLLAGVADYQLKLGRLTKKRKPVNPSRSRRQGEEAAVNQIEPPPPPADPKAAFKERNPEPEVAKHLVLGINEVSKELSIKLPGTALPVPPPQAAPGELTTSDAPAARPPRPPPTSPLRFVFVCLSDINPPSLVGHLPAAVAGYNGRKKACGETDSTGIRLVTLAKGAEALLAQALGVRRAAVVGVRASCPPALLNQLEAVLPSHILPPLLVEHLIPPSVKTRPPKQTATDRAPAFLPTQPGVSAAGASAKQQQQLRKTRPRATKALPAATRSLAPMRVKMVKTSAPKDMKAAKIERTLAVAQKRKAHKAVKKERARRMADTAAEGLPVVTTATVVAKGSARSDKKGKKAKAPVPGAPAA